MRREAIKGDVRTVVHQSATIGANFESEQPQALSIAPSDVTLSGNDPDASDVLTWVQSVGKV